MTDRRADPSLRDLRRRTLIGAVALAVAGSVLGLYAPRSFDAR